MKNVFTIPFIYLATFTLNCSNLSMVALSITSAPLNTSTSSFGTLYSSLSPSEVITIEVSVTAVSLPTGCISLVLTPLCIIVPVFNT